MKKTLLMAILLIVLTGCNNDDDNSTTPVVEDTFPQQLEFTTIFQANTMNYSTFMGELSNQKFIVQNENDWVVFKDTLNELSGVSNMEGTLFFTDLYFSETEIDFTTFQVIAVFDEFRPQGGGE